MSQKNILFVKIGVALVALVIFFLWAFNLKNVWSLNRQTAADPDAASAWTVFRNDIDRTMAAARGQFNQLAAETEQTQRAGQDFLLALLLKAQRDSVASSSPATTTDLKTPSDCPAWINCMPRVINPGDKTPPAPCQVPAGCEGITQIAY